MNMNYANDLRKALVDIKNQLGIDAFVEQERFATLLSSLAPHLKPEKRMLMSLSKSGILEDIVSSCNRDEAIKDRVLRRALIKLEDEFIQPEIATEFLAILAEVLELNISIENIFKDQITRTERLVIAQPKKNSEV